MMKLSDAFRFKWWG